MDDRQFEIMGKFVKGGVVEKNEERFIRELASIGYVRIGFSSTPEPGSFKETAILTQSGLEKYDLERRSRRGGLLRFIDNLLSLY